MAILKTYKCRKCESENIVKNGKSPAGRQKYHCKDCDFYSTLEPFEKYSEEKREEILKTYQESPSMRGIQRVYGVCFDTLKGWLKKSSVTLQK